MRTVNLTLPSAPDHQPSRTARLTRHLLARLNDFGPGGPEVLQADQSGGFVSVRFPGHDPKSVLTQLKATYGVSAALEGNHAVFYLSPSVSFEDLDYTWGCLFQLL